MRPDEAGLDVFASLLEGCGRGPSPWAAVDEIGYLECSSNRCRSAVEALLERRRVLAVVRRQDLPFLHGLRQREDVYLVDLDAPPEVGCVVMASGLGRRYGGDKLLAELDGKPLLQWVLEATEGVFARRLVVTRSQGAAELCKALDVDVELHSLPERSGAIHLGLSHAALPGGCAFFSGDQPLVRPGSAGALALAAQLDGAAIWRLAWGGTAGAPVLFPPWSYEALRRLLPGESGRTVAAAHQDRVRLLPAEAEEECFDVDTPDDLCRLQTLLRGKRKGV